MFDVKNSIFQVTSEKSDLEFDQFKTAFDKGIQRYAPTKSCMFENWPRLRNKFLNTKSDIDRKACNKEEKILRETSAYNLGRNDTFEKRKVHSVYHSTESLSFLGPKIWDLVPVELKQSETLYSFK